MESAHDLAARRGAEPPRWSQIALSFASAIPIAGYGASAVQGAKYADEAIDAVDTVVDTAKTADKAKDAAKAADNVVPPAAPKAATPPKPDPPAKPKDAPSGAKDTTPAKTDGGGPGGGKGDGGGGKGKDPQSAPGGKNGPGVSIKQVKMALGRADMSVAKYDIVHVPEMRTTGDGVPAFGNSPHGQLMLGIFKRRTS